MNVESKAKEDGEAAETSFNVCQVPLFIDRKRLEGNEIVPRTLLVSPSRDLSQFLPLLAGGVWAKGTPKASKQIFS